MSEQLYNTRILRLAASIPHERRLDAAQASVRKVSPICGSRVTIDLDMDADGRVARIGQEVRACALGQASAAILGRGVIGCDIAALRAARDGLRAFLSGAAGAPPAGWDDFDIFAPARAHKARHASILLAWDAAAEAAAEATAAETGAI
ncbi:iron-sulfur cluster assembly scaffold protein [Pacificimonas sp. WHA3]|uniref:Iron-sulfur cluster assembly scaffold protein n=1 Tax=Pacificimonas pallii TaxID=2827236 RepID=A0ABS6SCE0_9SPHN|nr:iron-sulfur cluster assembly scaffold protein [Pacificimonas pallii]MBV7256092.1 iron-sulfur cluster assembly scaffold protein [Pacificimonas pallii]